LPSPYSSGSLHRRKAILSWALVSVPISGLPLSRPVPVIGLVSRYLTNYLIGRSPILGRQRKHGFVVLCARNRSRPSRLSRVVPSFPGLSSSQGQVGYVLLSRPPRLHRCLKTLTSMPKSYPDSSGVRQDQPELYGRNYLLELMGYAKPTLDLSVSSDPHFCFRIWRSTLHSEAERLVQALCLSFAHKRICWLINKLNLCLFCLLNRHFLRSWSCLM